MPNDSFFYPILKQNGTIQFDVDFSKLGFGHLATVKAFNAIPGGQGDSRLYCDAMGSSFKCPQVTVMEADQHFWRTALHPCSLANELITS